MMPLPQPPIKLIAIDMDGTLLGSNGRVSPRNAAALHAAQSAGIEIVVATGRRHCYAMHILRDLNLHHANALVSSNGTVIRTIGSDLLHRSHMPLSTARWLCDHVTGFRSTLVITFDTVQPNGEDTRGALVVEDIDDLHNSIGRWTLANEPYIANIRPIEDALLADAPIQMMLCGPIARMRQAEALLLEHPRVSPVGPDDSKSNPDTEVQLHRTEYPDRDLCILDILPAGCSKASALQHLAAVRGISTDQILAIGDNWNDVPMLELAGHAILMSNAPDDLKQFALERGWPIGLSNDEDGVAIAIEAAIGMPAMVV